MPNMFSGGDAASAATGSLYGTPSDMFGTRNPFDPTQAENPFSKSSIPGITTGTPGAAPGGGTGLPGGLPSLGTGFPVGSQGQFTGVSPLDPGLTQQFFNWLQSQAGKGAPAFGGSVPLPTGGTSTPGSLTAPMNPVYQQLLNFMQGKGSTIPGATSLSNLATGKGNIPGATMGAPTPVSPNISAGLQQMAKSGDPVDQTAAWKAMVAAEQHNIAENAAQLREQFNVSGANPGSSSPGAIGMGDFYTQTALGQNAQLTQAQTTALENAAQRQLAAQQFIQGQTQQAGEFNVGEQQAQKQFNAQQQQQAQEFNTQIQQASSEFLSSAAQSLGNAFQGMDQQAITNALSEFIRTSPQYSPLLNAIMSAAQTSPQVLRNVQSPGLLALIGALPGILQNIPGITNIIKGRLPGSIPTPGPGAPGIPGVPGAPIPTGGGTGVDVGPGGAGSGLPGSAAGGGTPGGYDPVTGQPTFGPGPVGGQGDPNIPGYPGQVPETVPGVDLPGLGGVIPGVAPAAGTGVIGALGGLEGLPGFAAGSAGLEGAATGTLTGITDAATGAGVAATGDTALDGIATSAASQVGADAGTTGTLLASAAPILGAAAAVLGPVAALVAAGIIPVGPNPGNVPEAQTEQKYEVASDDLLSAVKSGYIPADKAISALSQLQYTAMQQVTAAGQKAAGSNVSLKGSGNVEKGIQSIITAIKNLPPVAQKGGAGSLPSAMTSGFVQPGTKGWYPGSITSGTQLADQLIKYISQQSPSPSSTKATVSEDVLSLMKSMGATPTQLAAYQKSISGVL